MATHASVRGSVVTAVLLEFAERGGSPDGILEDHGLTRAMLADPHKNVPLTRYIAMFESMAHHLGDPLFGARLGGKLRPVDLGPAGLLMARSASVKVALERLTRFRNSFQPGTHSMLREADNLLVWTYRLNDPAIWPRRQDAEFTLSSLVQIIRLAFAPDLEPVQVQFEHAPASTAATRELKRIFGCPVRFEAAANGVMLPLREAQVRCRVEDHDLIAVLERYLVDLSALDAYAENWRDKVMALISAYLGQQSITIDRIAGDLATSPRSLQRRLAEEGTSLRKLLRSRRQELADHRFQASPSHLGNLAEALGYADGTTFGRAHRNWTGQTPSSARAGRKADTP